MDLGSVFDLRDAWSSFVPHKKRAVSHKTPQDTSESPALLCASTAGDSKTHFAAFSCGFLSLP